MYTYVTLHYNRIPKTYYRRVKYSINRYTSLCCFPVASWILHFFCFRKTWKLPSLALLCLCLLFELATQEEVHKLAKTGGGSSSSMELSFDDQINLLDDDEDKTLHIKGKSAMY